MPLTKSYFETLPVPLGSSAAKIALAPASEKRVED
jgi:hypothetical protein